MFQANGFCPCFFFFKFYIYLQLSLRSVRTSTKHIFIFTFLFWHFHRSSLKALTLIPNLSLISNFFYRLLDQEVAADESRQNQSQVKSCFMKHLHVSTQVLPTQLPSTALFFQQEYWTESIPSLPVLVGRGIVGCWFLRSSSETSHCVAWQEAEM